MAASQSGGGQSKAETLVETLNKNSHPSSHEEGALSKVNRHKHGPVAKHNLSFSCLLHNLPLFFPCSPTSFPRALTWRKHSCSAATSLRQLLLSCSLTRQTTHTTQFMSSLMPRPSRKTLTVGFRRVREWHLAVPPCGAQPPLYIYIIYMQEPSRIE